MAANALRAALGSYGRPRPPRNRYGGRAGDPADIQDRRGDRGMGRFTGTVRPVGGDYTALNGRPAINLRPRGR